MILQQLYTKCLAQGAYFLSSNGEAAIVDPLREIQPYIELAREHHSKIKYIFLTHFHADFVSGQVDLAKATGATVILGPTAQAGYNFHSALDNEVFPVGDLTLTTIHTPGHTMESTCFLLKDSFGKAEALFTGDTLFIGDVGRPDLAAKSDLTTEDLAGHLYDSLHNRIAPLPDDLIIYPAHGAGSACGKNMSSDTSDTLANQKATNYAFKLSKEAFIKELTNGLATPPAYFPLNVAMNKKENKSFQSIIEKGTTPLSVTDFEMLSKKEDVLVLDTRDVSAFAKAYIPQSWFIGLKGQFAPWVGSLVKDIHQKIIFIAAEGEEEEVVTRLARVGYDNSLGYLEGGFAAWEAAGKPIEQIQEITAQAFVEGLINKDIKHPVDVRKLGEYNTSHIEKVPHFALSNIHFNINDLTSNKEYHIHCAGGYRSLIYASIAKSYGIHKVVNVLGGYGAIKKVADSKLILT
ncbi:MBL fold metallo-hydrolase [Dokdonia sp. Hel_I_53]|uniref:MBL fold metallo-hydrolase n=1 Tax=Dokdonia sp. Hel_I_53 TaxID=1566287 RepID=UPI00119B8065|nr:MBL fold metallo-hydrolase [Dokdonia sp. Hel_I_53]TVZ51893.1 glyoxylase-like metal-dependent hydrolase (beta-lactamase superfamily II) [Dokdonia sp. Hel_I_53]